MSSRDHTTTNHLAGRAHIGVTVTFFCHDGAGQYLFSKRGQACRDEHGCWDPGGGRVQFGETTLETLQREVLEEYNSPVLESEFLGYRDVHRIQEGTPTHWLSLDFRVKVDRSQARNNEPHKLDDLQWFALDNLPTPMHSQWASAYEKYADQLK